MNCCKRTPRTLEEAFGPYTSRNLVSEYDRRAKEIRTATGIAIAAAVALLVVALLVAVL